MNIIKKILAMAALLISPMLASGCGNNAGIRTVSANEFKTEIETPDVQIVDVRTPAEFSEGHIPGAVNINVQSREFLPEALRELKKDCPVYVYCRSGKRSLTAAAILVENGFKVVNLKGGIMEWKSSDLPVVAQ